ncbi:GrpB family protein [Tardiphaga robiniae]|uniref:GrpB family protein n=1 Tax=Tardiphaga robiniae TaxID=943830 RepID=A0A7G6U1C8_9BRAD|nr:GrpB family protein [Tardiphaga robiniae]QND72810.1 GrpB family protein [Tardiphaga robiniae]
MRKPVIIVPYDPAWPAKFVQIRDEILAALGSTALAVEHIGSTSVPGLDAKPIIDIDVIISTEADLSTAISKLSKAGYTYEGEKGIEGRHALAQPSGLPAHHLYVCAAGNPELKRHIAFRDSLRANPDVAKSYGALKKCLAEKFGSDREGYTDAKAAFIAEVLLNLSHNS